MDNRLMLVFTTLGLATLAAVPVAAQTSGVPGDGIPDVYYFAQATVAPNGESRPQGTLLLDTDGLDLVTLLVAGPDFTQPGTCTVCDGSAIPDGSLPPPGIHTIKAGYANNASQWIRINPLEDAGPTGLVDLAERVGVGPTQFPQAFDGWGVVFATESSGEVFTDVTYVQSGLVVDGFRDPAYGAPVAVQAVDTGFGDALPPGSPPGSELDAAYARIEGDRLYLLLTGNLETNFNRLELFIDSTPGGENVLSATPDYDYLIGGASWTSSNLGGLTFDVGFDVDYHLFAGWGSGGPFEVRFVKRQGGTSAMIPGSVGLGSVPVGLSSAGSIAPGGAGMGSNASGPALSEELRFAINNNNAAGVGGGTGPADPAAVLAVQTGLEFSIALADLGGVPPGSTIRFAAMICNGDHNYLSNQLLGAVPAGTGNLGGDGAGGFIGDLSGVNLGTFAGDQFVDSATGPLIWDQSGADAATSANVSDRVAADDFTLTATTRLTAVHALFVDGSLIENGMLDNFGGTLGWAIYEDAGGQPGAIIASGSTAAVGLTDTGVNDAFGDDIVLARIELEPVSLVAGVYWLGLREGQWADPADGTTIWWSKSLAGGGAPAHVAEADVWQSVDWDTAFVLYGDPHLVVGELIFGSGFETGGRWAWQSPSPPAKRRTTNPGVMAKGHVGRDQGAATKR